MRLEFKESKVFESKESQAYPRNIYKWSINTWKDAHCQHLLEKNENGKNNVVPHPSQISG